MKEWTTPDCRNTPTATKLEEEEIVNAPGNGGNASMPEQVKRPNPWRKMMMMMMMMIITIYNHQTILYSTHVQYFDIPNYQNMTTVQYRIPDRY